MDTQILKDLFSVLVHLHEGYLELAEKLTALESSFMEDVLDHKQSRRTYQKYLSQLEEIKQRHGQGFERYAECEKTLANLRNLMAEPAPPRVTEKRTVEHPDPDAHLGRRGVE